MQCYKQSLVKCLAWHVCSTWDGLSHLLPVWLQLTLQPPSVAELAVAIGAILGFQFLPSLDKSAFLLVARTQQLFFLTTLMVSDV